MRLTELARTDDTMTEVEWADMEWEATLRQHAADGTLAAIGHAVKEEHEQGQTEAL